MSIHLTQSQLSLSVPCPLCGANSQRKFRKYGIWIRDCDRCLHRFAELETSVEHLTWVYGDDYFEGSGAGYPNYKAEAKILRKHGQRYGKILQRYTGPGYLLDVGSAAGFILQGLIDTGWRGEGLEPNASMAHHARQWGHLIHHTALEDFQGTQHYDLVVMVQVVAHFYDVQKALAVASRQTKSGGFWLIETWNRDSWMARILQQHWHEYSPPSVLHWFSPDHLAQFSQQYGFQEVGRGRPSKWLNVAHAKALLSYKLQQSAIGRICLKGANWVPDDWEIPYPSEDLFWMVLQKV
jgi:SAM-dependent methyltransferase